MIKETDERSKDIRLGDQANECLVAEHQQRANFSSRINLAASSIGVSVVVVCRCRLMISHTAIGGRTEAGTTAANGFTSGANEW